MIKSINEEKNSFVKIQFIYEKNSEKLKYREFPQLIKNIYRKSAANTRLNGD